MLSNYPGMHRAHCLSWQHFMHVSFMMNLQLRDGLLYQNTATVSTGLNKYTRQMLKHCYAGEGNYTQSAQTCTWQNDTHVGRPDNLRPTCTQPCVWELRKFERALYRYCCLVRTHHDGPCTCSSTFCLQKILDKILLCHTIGDRLAATSMLDIMPQLVLGIYCKHSVGIVLYPHHNIH